MQRTAESVYNEIKTRKKYGPCIDEGECLNLYRAWASLLLLEISQQPMKYPMYSQIHEGGGMALGNIMYIAEN